MIKIAIILMIIIIIIIISSCSGGNGGVLVGLLVFYSYFKSFVFSGNQD